MKWVTVAAALLVLAGCGKNFCVMSFGECDQANKPKLQTSPSSSSPLSITASAPTVLINEKLTFTAKGGTSPYKFSIISGGGSIDESTGIFTAPSARSSVIVRVTDAQLKIAEISVLVQERQ